jgi:hypothetical protein
LATLEKGRPQRDMLRPGHRPVPRGQVLNGLGEDNNIGCRRQSDLPLKTQLGLQESCGEPQSERVPIDGTNVVGRDWRLAVNCHSNGRLVRTGWPKKVETDIVTKNAGKKPRLGVRAIFGMLCWIVAARFNRRPRGKPERVYSRCFMEDLGHVATFDGYCDTDQVILDLSGSASVIGRGRHGLKCMRRATPGKRKLDNENL